MNRILIIDDDDQLRELYRDLFEGAGFEVDEAADGFAALQVYSRSLPDVVLCDILMPGMNGLLTISELLRAHPGARIVAISGATPDRGDYLAAARQLGAVATLQKPFNVDELLDTIVKAVGVEADD